MFKIINDIKWTFKVYALTLTLPLTLSIINIILFGILGIETKSNIWVNFKIIWIDYYITGYLLNIVAWRWQILLFLCSFLLVKFGKYEL